jgi:hypothetical protein
MVPAHLAETGPQSFRLETWFSRGLTNFQRPEPSRYLLVVAAFLKLLVISSRKWPVSLEGFPLRMALPTRALQSARGTLGFLTAGDKYAEERLTGIPLDATRIETRTKICC